MSLRDATLADIDALSILEARSFDGDRLSRRSFRRLIGTPGASFRLAVRGNRIVGYAATLFRRDSPFARLYSIAVDPAARGDGIGAALLRDAEMIAAARGCEGMRLEVRQDNGAAIRLYRRRGYGPLATLSGYYHDGAGAFRLQKIFDGPAAGEGPSRER